MLMSLSDHLPFGGDVTGDVAGPDAMAFVIDNEMANVNPVQEEVIMSVSFSFNFTLEQYGVHLGFRTFTFYAADSDGNAASPLTVSRTVVAPTRTVSDTRSESRPRHTHARSGVRDRRDLRPVVMQSHRH
jgi:hypothetical protein